MGSCGITQPFASEALGALFSLSSQYSNSHQIYGFAGAPNLWWQLQIKLWLERMVFKSICHLSAISSVQPSLLPSQMPFLRCLSSTAGRGASWSRQQSCSLLKMGILQIDSNFGQSAPHPPTRLLYKLQLTAQELRQLTHASTSNLGTKAWGKDHQIPSAGSGGDNW